MHTSLFRRAIWPSSICSSLRYFSSEYLSDRDNRKKVDESVKKYFRSMKPMDVAVRKSSLKVEVLRQHFEASCVVRALDNVMDLKETKGEAFYSIGSGGHEAVGLVMRALRSTDPYCPHYRDNQALIERGFIADDDEVVMELVNGYLCKGEITHKVLASKKHHIIPNSPTIGPKFPQMVGLAISFHLPKFLGVEPEYPQDSICVVSGGDGTVNHPSVLSSLNLARYYKKRKIPCPILFLISDNGIAISEKPLKGETEEFLKSWGLPYFEADSKDPVSVYETSKIAADLTRESKAPVILKLKTARLFGHSANPRNETISTKEMEEILASDPLLHTAQELINQGGITQEECLEIYHDAHVKVNELTKQSSLPVKKRTMRQLLTRTYQKILERSPDAMFIGQDVSPGHYGVGIGLKNKFPKQVQGFPIDEIGLAAFGVGLSWNGVLPIIEISYKAYQQEGALSQLNDAMLLRFLSPEYFKKGFILRMPALGLGKGGPTHTENAFLERMIPGAKVFCFGSGYSAVLGTRAAFDLAKRGHPVVCNEPTSLYFQGDLFSNDGKWLFEEPSERKKFEYGDVIGYRLGAEVELVSQEELMKKREPLRILTFGNGLPMALRASKEFNCSVVEFPNLFASEQLLNVAENAEKILIVDECRPTGCPGESVIRALNSRGYKGKISIVNSDETYNPSGPAQKQVYLSEEKITSALRSI